MKTGAARRLLPVAGAAVITACGSSGEPTGPAPPLSGPSFSVSFSGDVRASFQGVPTSIRSASGYREADASGVVRSTSVVLVQLASSDPSRPALSIGLMGPIQPTAYTLHSVGSAVPGSKAEYYGVITQRGSDGTNDYSATSGTVTLTAVGDTLRGAFALHYGNVVHYPPNPPAGEKYPVTGASVDASGTFVVPAPTVSLP